MAQPTWRDLERLQRRSLKTSEKMRAVATRRGRLGRRGRVGRKGRKLPEEEAEQEHRGGKKL